MKRKYSNKKTTRTIGRETYEFDSLKEARRFDDLILLLKAKKIEKLELQPEYILCGSFKHNGKTIRGTKYIADFRYTENGKTIVEDVKGMKTIQYQIKMKWFLTLYGDELTFKEIWHISEKMILY